MNASDWSPHQMENGSVIFLQASCLIESSAVEGSSQWDDLWSHTEERIKAKDSLILVG